MTPRTPEDARTNPQPGDTIQWTGREAPHFVRTRTCVSREGAYLTVEATRYDGSTARDTYSVTWWADWSTGTSSCAWVYVPVADPVPGARTPEDARLRPQAGDTLTVGGCHVLTVAGVVPRRRVRRANTKLHLTWVSDGIEEGTTWSLDTWSYRGDGRTWAPAAPKARDPRTDPQPGDVQTCPPAEDDLPYHTLAYRVLERDDTDPVRTLHVEYTLASGKTGREYMTVGRWADEGEDDDGWTWTRGDDVAEAPAVPATPAPEAPEAPRAWYETRGLPACLAALPTPTDGELEALDLWAALEGLGYLPTGADDSGRVTIAPDGATVYLGTNGRYAVQWDDGRVYPPGGLAAALAAYTRARTPEHDPRTDPQVGDTKTWTSDYHEDDYVRVARVMARSGDKVSVQETRYNGATHTVFATVKGWSELAGGWTFAVGAAARA